MRPEDRIRLLHMIEAAETAMAFADGRLRNEMETDRQLLFAITRAIEIIGEAASKVSSDTRQATVSIPWSRIISMRNRLAHAYFNVDPDILWRTVSEEIPDLLIRLRAAIGS